jgi:hypothetical protein
MEPTSKTAPQLGNCSRLHYRTSYGRTSCAIRSKSPISARSWPTIGLERHARAAAACCTTSARRSTARWMGHPRSARRFAGAWRAARGLEAIAGHHGDVQRTRVYTPGAAADAINAARPAPTETLEHYIKRLDHWRASRRASGRAASYAIRPGRRGRVIVNTDQRRRQCDEGRPGDRHKSKRVNLPREVKVTELREVRPSSMRSSGSSLLFNHPPAVDTPRVAPVTSRAVVAPPGLVRPRKLGRALTPIRVACRPPQSALHVRPGGRAIVDFSGVVYTVDGCESKKRAVSQIPGATAKEGCVMSLSASRLHVADLASIGLWYGVGSASKLRRVAMN